MKPLMALLMLTSASNAQCVCTQSVFNCCEKSTWSTITFTSPTTMIISRDGFSVTIDGKNIDDMRGPELLAAVHALALAMIKAKGVP
jgi:hypothetical protein